MLGSMYSGISGMKANQVKLDVIGNNIANVGTTAYKGSRARFQNMLSQNKREAMGPQYNVGGVNPSQVGLGVQLASIDKVITQGGMQTTGRPLDLAIDDGNATCYFMIAKGPKISGNEIGITNHEVSSNKFGAEMMYTRDGGFSLDHEGNIVTSDGFRVLGYSINGNTSDAEVSFVDATKGNLVADEGNLKSLRIPNEIAKNGEKFKVKTYSIDKQGLITATLDDNSICAIGQVAMASFKNPDGLTSIGKNILTQSSNSGIPVVMSGLGSTTNNNSKAFGSILSGALEMSNVDLSEQFTDMIVASRAFQASGKMITTGDEILQDIINLKR